MVETKIMEVALYCIAGYLWYYSIFKTDVFTWKWKLLYWAGGALVYATAKSIGQM